VLGNHMFMFGGKSNAGILSDLHVFDLKTQTWLSPYLDLTE